MLVFFPTGIISGQSFPPEGTSFEQILFDQKLTKSIGPFSYWNTQFFQVEPAYMRFDFTVMRGAKLGLYAKRNALPSHTQYDIFDVLNGARIKNSRATAVRLNSRAKGTLFEILHKLIANFFKIKMTVRKQAIHYMEKGNWFISLYNDGVDDQQVELVLSIADDLTQQCPNGCSENGECLMGMCQCNPGFGGNDCNDCKLPFSLNFA